MFKFPFVVSGPREIGNEAENLITMGMWYVVQVGTGREDAMARHIGRVAPDGVLEECFSPKYATEMKVRGEWVSAERDLFPGYVVAVTDRPAELDRALRSSQEFGRVLTVGDRYLPLARDEVQLIDDFTKKGERTVPMSHAIKEGDIVTVTAGPLRGREYLVKSVNRHKSLAFIEVDLCGRKLTTRVGLAIVTKEAAA